MFSLLKPLINEPPNSSRGHSEKDNNQEKERKPFYFQSFFNKKPYIFLLFKTNKKCHFLVQKKPIRLELAFLETNGGVEETRTLAPVNPIYFLSREAPSPTWVLLQVNAPYLNIKGEIK